MATKSNYQGVVDTLKDRLLTELGDRIHSIVLFGSVARGEATDDSDIDVLVITDGRSATEDRIQHVANDFSLANEVLAEVTTFSTQTFQTEVRMRSWLASDVLMQGRILTDDGTYDRTLDMSGEFGEMLSDAREHRTDSTYDPFPTVTHEIAEKEVRNAERFLDAANALLKPD